MSPDLTILITLCCEGALLQVAVKVKGASALMKTAVKYWAELENKEVIFGLLPPHTQIGEIVDVQEIFEVAVTSDPF